MFTLLVKCVDDPAVSSGVTTAHTDGVSTYASVSCASGYYVNGESLLTCNSDGSWDYETPACGNILVQCI